MSQIVTFEITAKKGMEKELLAFFKDTLHETSDFEGCMRVELHTEEQSEGTIFMFEEWKTKQNYENYLAWRGERGDMDKLMQFVDGPPTVRFFNQAD